MVALFFGLHAFNLKYLSSITLKLSFKAKIRLISYQGDSISFRTPTCFLFRCSCITDVLPWYVRSTLQTLQVIFLFAVSRLKCSQTFEVLLRSSCRGRHYFVLTATARLGRDVIAHARLLAETVLKWDASLRWKNTSGDNCRQWNSSLTILIIDFCRQRRRIVAALERRWWV